MTGMVLVAAALLGVLSRVDERTGGDWSVSTNATWLALGLVAGATAGRRERAAVLGIAVLTVANAAYYACIALTEPATALSAPAGPPLRWFALGIGGGVVTGVIGHACTSGPRRARVPALALALLTVGVGPSVEPLLL